MPSTQTTKMVPGALSALANSPPLKPQISAGNIQRAEGVDKRQGILQKHVIKMPIRRRHGSHDPPVATQLWKQGA